MGWGWRCSSIICSITAAFVANPDGTFAVDPAKIKAGVEGLTREIMTLQAEGNYEKAKDAGAKLGVVRPEVQKALDKMKRSRSISSRSSPPPSNSCARIPDRNLEGRAPSRPTYTQLLTVFR